jgi:hypothetical protein
MTSQLDDRIRSMMQQVVDESPPPPDLPTEPRREPATQRRVPNWAVAVGAAVAVFILVGGVVWLLGGTGSGVIDEPTPTTAAIPSTTSPEPTPTTAAVPSTTSPEPTTAATVTIEAAGWNTVLADTQAKVPPAPATCPSSTTPNPPDASDQPRPAPGWVGNLAGAFDRHMGRIVYVDTARKTWTFDVCTNTWHRMNPNSGPAHTEPVGQLVYDIDSDVTIALGYGGVSVYDANTNTWSIKAPPPANTGMLGAVYDPISGLVITSTNHGGEDWDLWTYDVDTDKWTLLGTVTVDRDTPCCTQIDLLGYASGIDRLILTTYISSPTTILINPRTGETTFRPTSTGLVNLAWPGSVYGPGGDTVYVYPGSPGTLGISGFDSATATWVSNKSPAEVPSRYAAFGAVVGDPINNRLILINGVHGDWWSDATDDIWAVDLTTGEWTQILAPATPE